MRNSLPLVLLALLASPAVAAASPEAALVGNADGSVTLTGTIDSDAPNLVLQRAARPARNAAHARARSQAQAELDRAFQEATAQAREAARVPPPR